MPGGGPSKRHHGQQARRRVNLPPKRAGGTATPAAAPAADTTAAGPDLPFRVGHGYDLHRLEPRPPHGRGRPMIIGGVTWDSAAVNFGPVAHSDGDVLYHAVTDALLGALGLPDIGQLFPDKAPENDGRDSAEFLVAAVQAVAQRGYVVGNLDATVILEKPKIGPVKQRVRANLARLLGVPAERVNIKGKTHEKVDAVGEGLAVEAHAVVLLVRAVE